MHTKRDGGSADTADISYTIRAPCNTHTTSITHRSPPRHQHGILVCTQDTNTVRVCTQEAPCVHVPTNDAIAEAGLPSPPLVLFTGELPVLFGDENSGSSSGFTTPRGRQQHAYRRTHSDSRRPRHRSSGNVAAPHDRAHRNSLGNRAASLEEPPLVSISCARPLLCCSGARTRDNQHIHVNQCQCQCVR